MTETTCDRLAAAALEVDPTTADLELAESALLDTAACILAAREDPLRSMIGPLSEAGRLAALAHVLDFDDLHLPSTAHISAVCVPAVLAFGGGARDYLAGAGTMARIGTALGWNHYRTGWHATCTAGAPGAAAAAARALGLDREGISAAIALSLPAAGGVQRAFGTPGKSIQVGMATAAGVAAAELAAAGATADPAALDQWLRLLGGDPGRTFVGCSPEGDKERRGGGEAVPGGLAVKLYPCCYALQRVLEAASRIAVPDPEGIRSIRVRTPSAALQPLREGLPNTGLEAKFSLPYALATALLDGSPGIPEFTDAAVARPAARRLMELVEIEALPGGEGLLTGSFELGVVTSAGETLESSLEVPLGAPGRAAGRERLRAKLRACAGGAAEMATALTWDSAEPARLLPSA